MSLNFCKIEIVMKKKALLCVIIFSLALSIAAKPQDNRKYYLKTNIGVCTESNILGPALINEFASLIGNNLYFTTRLVLSTSFGDDINEEAKFPNPKINYSYYSLGLNLIHSFFPDARFKTGCGIVYGTTKRIEYKEYSNSRVISNYSAIIDPSLGVSLSLDYQFLNTDHFNIGTDIIGQFRSSRVYLIGLYFRIK